MSPALFRLFAAVLVAPLLAGAALAEAPGTTDAGNGRTPTQPTASDPSVGLPSQPATMTKNPEAMSPDAARERGTAPVKPDGR